MPALTTSTTASTALSTFSLTGLAWNKAGIPADFCDGLIGCLIPHRFSTVDRTDLYNWWAAHKAAVDAL